MNDRDLAEYVVLWLGGFMLIFLAFVLGWAHFNKRNPIDLAMLIVDPHTRKLSAPSFAVFLALLATTWAMIYLTVTKSMTEGYLTVYLTAWAGFKVLMSKLNQGTPAPDPTTK